MRLERKVALITGGYGGMGHASARLFAKEGATVFIAGRNEERGNALAAEINEAGGKVRFVKLDVVEQALWNAAVTQVKEQAGALHVLMNIVDSNALVRLPKVDIDEWIKIFEINVTGTRRGIQTCAPLIKRVCVDRRRVGGANRGGGGRCYSHRPDAACSVPPKSSGNDAYSGGVSCRCRIGRTAWPMGKIKVKLPPSLMRPAIAFASVLLTAA